jgi:hypothetical protein
LAALAATAVTLEMAPLRVAVVRRVPTFARTARQVVPVAPVVRVPWAVTVAAAAVVATVAMAAA